MNEFLWTGLCMAINSKNEEFGPIGLGTIMDFRRILPQEKVTNTLGSVFTHFYLFIKNVNPRMTISEICSKFRKQLNQFRENDLFFYNQYLHPFNYAIQNCQISHVSNIGQIKSNHL